LLGRYALDVVARHEPLPLELAGGGVCRLFVETCLIRGVRTLVLREKDDSEAWQVVDDTDAPRVLFAAKLPLLHVSVINDKPLELLNITLVDTDIQVCFVL
jgi:hypothetical protein